MHGCPCQNQTYYDGSPPKNSVPIFLISPCCSGLFLRGHCLSQERSYTKSCSTTTPKSLTASSQDIPPSVGFVPSVSWWHNSHTPAEQRAGAGSLSPSQTVPTHYGLLAKTHAALEHISQTFCRSKRKPEGDCHGIDSVHQTVHTNWWPLRKQGQVPKAPWTCFNRFSTFHNYRTSQRNTADISTDVAALCQSDSAIKEQEVVCKVPKLAWRMNVYAALHEICISTCNRERPVLQLAGCSSEEQDVPFVWVEGKS